MRKFDAIIIGTGQAGSPLAAKLASDGLQVAIIEKSLAGGTCVNVGCTPTKAYVASARRAFIAKNSKDLGVEVEGKIKVNLKKIKSRKDKLVLESRKGLEEMLEGKENITFIKGKAVFTGKNTIAVNGEELSAEKIYINVGARATEPEQFKKVPYLTNESILQLDEVPKHLIVVGGGYIGLEFSQMFRRFGSKVTIVEKGKTLLTKEDPDISEAIEGILKDEGISIQFESDCIDAEVKKNNQISVTVNCNKKTQKITGSHLLLAVGRTPNTDDLGLDKAGIQTDGKGYIRVNSGLQTNLKNVWALGDCNGKGAFTHTAYNDYEIVASNLSNDKKRYVTDRFLCYALYIDPPFARVGMNAKDIKENKLKAKVAVRSMERIARAKEKGETKGLLKIYVEDKTNKFLGASFLGVGADEYIHTIIDSMYGNIPYTTIRDAVHIHPTVSELLPTMLEELKAF